MPEVAVIIPVHNRAAAVRRAIGSVLAQDFPDFEIVVIDDASTDGSADVVRSLGDERIRLIIATENRGPSAARNRGIVEASAPLVCFLDSDDVFLPHKLSTIVGRFRAEPDLGLLVDSFCTSTARGRRYRRNPAIQSNQEFIQALFARRLWKATPAINVRRSVAIAAGLFDESLHRREDFEFLVRVAAVARCASAEDLLWLKSKSPNSLSAPLDTFIPATVRLVQKHPEYLILRRYRIGLTRDLLRHCVRLLWRRRFGIFIRDVRALARAFGGAFLLLVLSDCLTNLGSRNARPGV